MESLLGPLFFCARWFVELAVLNMAYSGEDPSMSVVDVYVDAAVEASKAVDYCVEASACAGAADNYYYAEAIADDGS